MQDGKHYVSRKGVNAVTNTTIKQDKKNENNQVCFTLLSTIGSFEINIHANDDLILEAIDYYKNL